MRNRMYGGVRGRKTKVGRKLLRFPPTRLAWVAMVPFGSVLPLRRPLSGEADLAPSGISVNSIKAGFSETTMPTSQSFGYDWNNVTIQTEISLLLQL